MAIQNLRVLVVDDDVFFRELLSRILTQRGYEVFSARTVMEAQRLLSNEIDLLFVDYRMPGVDGVTWIKQLRESGCILPIVFCSGSGCDASKLSLLRNVLDVNLIITKPIDAQQLGLQLDELLTIVCRRNCSDGELLAEAQSNEVHNATELFEEDQCKWPVNEEITSGNCDAVVDDSVVIKDSGDGFVDESIELELAILAQEYLTQVPEIIGQIRLGLIMAQVNHDNDHFESTINLVHQIRGTAGSLGFSRLSECASRLEDLLRSQNLENMVLNAGLSEEINEFLDSAMSICREYGCVESNIGGEEMTSVGEVSVQSALCEQVPDFAFVPEVGHIFESVFEEAEGRSLLNCRKGLIVDQNALRAKEIVDTMKSDGWFFRTCFSCLEALSVIDEFLPEVLFLAANMPSINGFDLCRMVRCNPLWQQLPIIIICDDLAQRKQAFSAGASEFVFSPLVEEEIRGRILKLCRAVVYDDESPVRAGG